MNKINYNLEMEKVIKKIDKDHKPRLLLHSCCGPCSSAILERINEYFDIDVFYYNPNIDSEKEFYRRADEQVQLVKDLGLEDEIGVRVIKYNHQDFLEYVKGFEEYKEGVLGVLSVIGRGWRRQESLLLKTIMTSSQQHFPFLPTRILKF